MLSHPQFVGSLSCLPAFGPFSLLYLDGISHVQPHTLASGGSHIGRRLLKQTTWVLQAPEFCKFIMCTLFEYRWCTCHVVYFLEARCDECSFLEEGRVGVEVLISPHITSPVFIGILKPVCDVVIILYSESCFKEGILFTFFKIKRREIAFGSFKILDECIGVPSFVFGVYQVEYDIYNISSMYP